MFTRWHHGHSTLLGVILGVAVFGGHLLWGLTFAFCFGVAVGRCWSLLGHLLRRLARQRSGVTVLPPRRPF